MLDLAAKAAFRATGHVEPNPLVGCVLVRPGEGPARERIIGIGHHRRFGGAHAEVEALRRCRELGNDPRGATAYVTLEPCNGFGKNPPCVTALVEAGIARVVCAARDDTEGKGSGGAALRAVEIPCEFTEVSQRATDLSAPWRHRVKTGRPWTIAKWAQTIDGRLATWFGDSKWISNRRSRLRVHRMRAAVDAVMVGSGTVMADDPQLSVRSVPLRRRAPEGGVRQPLRIVFGAKRLAVSGGYVVETAREQPTLVVCEALPAGGLEAELREAGVTVMTEPGHDRIDWFRRIFMRLYREHGVNTLLVEGGPTLLGSLFAVGLIDEAHVHTGPMFMGEQPIEMSLNAELIAARADAVQRLWKYRLVSVRRVENDVQSVYRGF
ncbi:MAG: bifunctional diaminohydroxyphosphoribosylaminopyrimidine deaminase/5-amino-6-(5-phosphoribosylamino)uracil reductase RibD [Phycisphaerales bacterium]|nr:bifunctional diaminohydroxyphosphoribosylaminopyrimidine deaminase/5-amino-6-(5-phosphoribosylamino)uracil reductase RibD [Phycisphaerales bacterium]